MFVYRCLLSLVTIVIYVYLQVLIKPGNHGDLCLFTGVVKPGNHSDICLFTCGRAGNNGDICLFTGVC